jgi:hypothetical protein
VERTELSWSSSSSSSMSFQSSNGAIFDIRLELISCCLSCARTIHSKHVYSAKERTSRAPNTNEVRHDLRFARDRTHTLP